MKTTIKQEQKLPIRFKNKLIRALRSGRYLHVPGTLRNPSENGYNPIGVAHRIAGVHKGSITKMGMSPSGRPYNFLPKVITNPNSKVVEKLSYLSDIGMSFKWIASHMEDHM